MKLRLFWKAKQSWQNFRLRKNRDYSGKIIIERRDITTATTQIKFYYGQLHINKLDKLEEMGKFLEIYNLKGLK